MQGWAAVIMDLLIASTTGMAITIIIAMDLTMTVTSTITIGTTTITIRDLIGQTVTETGHSMNAIATG